MKDLVGPAGRSLPPLKGMSQQLFGYIEPSHQPNSEQLTGAIDSRAPTGWRCIARLACYAAPVTTLYFETGPFQNIGNAEEVRNLPVRNYLITVYDMEEFRISPIWLGFSRPETK